MSNINPKIRDFIAKYKNKCFALQNWKERMVKKYSLMELLNFIYDQSEGSFTEMINIIDHLTEKRKVQGRTQVYDGDHNFIDIIDDENGNMKLVGYNPDAELQAKGQHVPRNPKIFRKTDDQVNKTFQNAEEKMYDLGEKVRELYPNESNHFITFAMQAIKKYAADRKISADKVVKGLQKGRYVIDSDIWRVIPNVQKESKERKVIVINESDMSRLSDFIEMTEQKFHSNIRRFISQLLQDPVNAQPSDLLKMHGYNRSILLKYLLCGNNPILIRDEHISDKDENGEPKTATMMVKFRCPKKNFDRKLQKLFIKLFEKNLPPRRKHTNEEELNEEGEGGACGGATSAASSGQFSQPVFPMMRRKMPTEIEETTATTNTGNYQYTVPFGGDKETLARKNGVGGSVSVNKM